MRGTHCQHLRDGPRSSEEKKVPHTFFFNMEGKDILYEIKGRAAIITLNRPESLNALTGDQYLLLGKLVERADREETTIVTILQSTGRYFSAGADPTKLVQQSVDNSEKSDAHKQWLANFVASNVYLTDVFHNHTKILVAAMNGPAIGLSSALIALCDLIYAIDLQKVFLLCPFANLGLVAEGAALSTLFLRLGWSTAAEALLLAKPIYGPDLNRLGFINKSYEGLVKSTEEFNDKVYQEITSQIANLHEPSILEMKQLLKANRDTMINAASSREVIKGFNKWIEGIPQSRFAQVMLKERRHKL